uniref:peptidylprolyl isomerase n=1 Tax=Glossina brevipalpis TaxID=37001 RepID=A0A1A9WZ09_9MUSC
MTEILSELLLYNSRGGFFLRNLRQREAIRDWDEGVADLLVGQCSKLICSPDNAYGSRGRPVVILLNFTFDVELLKRNHTSHFIHKRLFTTTKLPEIKANHNINPKKDTVYWNFLEDVNTKLYT